MLRASLSLVRKGVLVGWFAVTSQSFAAVVFNESGDFASSEVPGSVVIRLFPMETFVVNGSLNNGLPQVADVDFFQMDNLIGSIFRDFPPFSITVSNYSGVAGGVGKFELIGFSGSHVVDFGGNGTYFIPYGGGYPYLKFRVSAPFDSVGVVAGSADYSVSLATVPEPHCLVLLMAGFAGLGVRRRS